MVYTLCFFSLKCSLFHNSNVFGSVLFTFYIQGVLKLKKNNSGAKRLMLRNVFINVFIFVVCGSFSSAVGICRYSVGRTMIALNTSA